MDTASPSTGEPAPSFAHATVADAMHGGVLTCDPATPLVTIAQRMAAERIHAIVMLVGGVDPRERIPWAVVSDVELLRHAARAEELTACDAASTEMLQVHPDEPLATVAARMARRAVTHAVVVDRLDGRPIGVLVHTRRRPRARLGAGLTACPVAASGSPGSRASRSGSAPVAGHRRAVDLIGRRRLLRSARAGAGASGRPWGSPSSACSSSSTCSRRCRWTAGGPRERSSCRWVSKSHARSAPARSALHIDVTRAVEPPERGRAGELGEPPETGDSKCPS